MGIFDVNILQAIKNLLSPVKRKKITLAYLGVFGKVLQYLHDIFFKSYLGGSTVIDWDNSITYIKGQQIKYVDNSVYEALTGVPANTPPTIDNIYPNGVYWLKIQNIWIGATERTLYNGQLIMLELIMNKYFDVEDYSFPWKGASHITQMWISRATSINNTMWMGQLSVYSQQSYMAQSSKNAKNFMPQVATTSNDSRFTIHVPVAVYAAITATIPAGSADTAEALIRALVDKYIRAGRNYTIIQY